MAGDNEMSLDLNRSANSFMVMFNHDGTVEFGPDYEPTEAARVAWESLAEHNPLRSELEARRAAMDAAFITVKYGGDSTVKKLWRACGYDLPRKAR